MLKHKVHLESKKNNREHFYQCDPDTPLPEIYEVLGEFRSYVYGRIKEYEEINQPKVQPTDPNCEKE